MKILNSKPTAWSGASSHMSLRGNLKGDRLRLLAGNSLGSLCCFGELMPKLTITLPADLHQALKLPAARRRTTIGKIIAESLERYGVKTEGEARPLIARAREASGMPELRALDLAVRETRARRSLITSSKQSP
jgi:hypothetical protein